MVEENRKQKGASVAQAFLRIFLDSKKPSMICTDMGQGFNAKAVQSVF